MDNIQNKIWNIELVVEEIKKFPQTYGTILGCRLGDGTCELIVRRKLNILCKDGTICKAYIPGTRFSRMIFYYIPKDYTIMIESTRMGSDVYAFYHFEKMGQHHILVKEYWQLMKDKWEHKIEERLFYEGHIIKWI